MCRHSCLHISLPQQGTLEMSTMSPTVLQVTRSPGGRAVQSTRSAGRHHSWYSGQGIPTPLGATLTWVPEGSCESVVVPREVLGRARQGDYTWSAWTLGHPRCHSQPGSLLNQDVVRWWTALLHTILYKIREQGVTFGHHLKGEC